MFYTPETRDRKILPHDPIKAIVAPRPIGWISTVSKSGAVNLAPYSFFNLVGGMPPMLMFSSEGLKDTANHAIETGEFVHNYVGTNVANEMNASSIPAPTGISEFDHCNIQKAESNIVRPPRVAKALAALECKVTEVLETKTIDGEKTGAVMVIGQVVGIHIDEVAIRDGRFDVTLTEPVTRLGYLDFGLSGGFHEMVRPSWSDPNA